VSRTCRRVPIGIGAGSTISNTIVDKNARIGENCTIVNKEGIEEANKEDEGFYIRSGIVTVRCAGSVLLDGIDADVWHLLKALFSRAHSDAFAVGTMQVLRNAEIPNNTEL
jgi:hypothetical protein